MVINGWMKIWLTLVLGLLLVLPASTIADAARLKEITNIKGVRENQLIGYGLVVGLNKSGDDQKILYTIQSLTSMLSKLGVRVDPAEIRARNVAAVMVTAKLPPFAKAGNTVDIVVSSVGNAKSLMGGTLLLTPLRGVDNEIYAMAQGPLIVGGYGFSGAGGTSVQKNHPTVGRIPDGAIVERELAYHLDKQTDITLSLIQQDFTTAARISNTINAFLEGPYARAKDAGSVVMTVPAKYRANVVELVAQIENLHVIPDRVAKVVMNERTGTVVMGAEVRIATIAVSHGNLKVEIINEYQVSQPAPFSEGGKTVTVPKSNVTATEEESKLSIVEEGVSIGQVVGALNSIGVTPRDLIDILQAIKAAGALEAELEIM